MNLSLENEHKSEEKSEIEKDNANIVVEPGEEIKNDKTMEVVVNIADPKTELEADLESTRDMATMTGQSCHIFHNKCYIL